MLKKMNHWKGPAVLGLSIAAISVGAANTVAAPHEGDHSKVAKVGEEAPNFTLMGVDGKEYTLEDYKGKTVVLEWYNPGCPWCVKVYKNGTVKDVLKQLKAMGGDEKTAYLAINSTANMPKDAVIEGSKALMKETNTNVPVLVDYDGKTGHMYAAKTTPHVYIIDAEGVLRYHGAIADRNDMSTNYAVNALKQIASGDTVTPDHVKQWGCSVKYAKKDSGSKSMR